MVTNPRQLPAVVDIAVRNALAKQTVAHLSFPQRHPGRSGGAGPYEDVGPAHPPASLPVFAPPSLPLDPARPRAAADVLAAGSKVAMLVGKGALAAGDEVLGSRTSSPRPNGKTLPDKAVVPDDDPLTSGGWLLGTRPSELLRDHDGRLACRHARLGEPSHDPVVAPIQFLMSRISRAAAGDALLTCDSGTIATWAARHWTIRGSRRFRLSGNLATHALVRLHAALAEVPVAVLSLSSGADIGCRGRG